ncbi:MAG: hypothetical protein ACFFD4_34360 [Candidatus Odinarchaeota archaeon]
MSSRVSKVGARNQVTLPKSIRNGLNLVEGLNAYIGADEKGNYLIISLQDSPDEAFDEIRISNKGQLIIPKKFRNLKGISEGSNLVFTVISATEITVQKLLENRKEQEIKWRWNFLIEIIGTLDEISGIRNLEFENGSLVLITDNISDFQKKELVEMLVKIENLTGLRLMFERRSDYKMALIPVISEKHSQKI